MVPQPYEELLAKLADKYGYEMAERNVETRAFNEEKEGNVLFIIVIWNLYLNKSSLTPNLESITMNCFRIHGRLRNRNIGQMLWIF